MSGYDGRKERDGRGGRAEAAGRAEPELIPKHGGYRRLKSFQIAQLVYDCTVRFCDRYIDRRSRTHDQMVQAARSGVANIAEGSQASGTSKKMELKLTNVARASLEELRLDYEDFLRHRGLSLWEDDDPRRAELVAQRCSTATEVAGWVRNAFERDRQDRQDGYQKSQPIPFIQSIQSTKSIKSIKSIQSIEGLAANAILVLIGVAGALLDRQIVAQAAAFESEGGFTERLHRVRQARRSGR